MQNMYSIFLYHSSETDIFIKMLLFCSTSWKIVPWLGISKSYSPAFGGRLWNFGAPCDTKYKRKALAMHAIVEYIYVCMTYFGYIRLVWGLEQQMTK